MRDKKQGGLGIGSLMSKKTGPCYLNGYGDFVLRALLYGNL